MLLKPLEVLRKGLKILEKQVNSRRMDLQTHLAEKKPISSQDDKWLDNNANLVNEQYVLDTLDKASDYERGLGRLNNKQKVVVRKLWELAGDLTLKVVGQKWKLTCF
jgi:hypothetical protein